MRLLAFTSAAYRQQAAYPVANAAGLFTNTLFLLFRAAFVSAVYGGGAAAVGGLGHDAAVGYIAVTQSMLMVAPQWGRVGLAEDVRTGQVAVELLRPVDFVGRYFASRLGVAAFYTLWRMIPLLAISAALGFLPAPSPAGLAGFVVSLALAATLGNAVLFLVEVTSFWLESEKGVRYLVLGLSLLPSGLALPVTWFPAPVQAIFLCTPFPYTLHLPTTLWLGTPSGMDAASGLAVQAAWVVGLLVACRWAFARGARRLVINGG